MDLQVPVAREDSGLLRMSNFGRTFRFITVDYDRLKRLLLWTSTAAKPKSIYSSYYIVSIEVMEVRIKLVFVKDEEVIDKTRLNVEKLDAKVIEELKKEYEDVDCDYIDIFVEKQLSSGERYWDYYDSIVLKYY